MTVQALATGSFTSSITGLTAGTQYYYRAYATNSQGTSYGTEYTFTTTQTGGTWARQTDFPMTGRTDVISFAIGSKGYTGMGYNAAFFKDIWEFDPSTCQWTQKADFGGTARQEASVFTIGTKAYVGTGEDVGGNKNDFWEYNQSTNIWTQKTSFPGAIRRNAIGLATSTKGYLGTGWNGSTFYQDWYEYDPTLDSWTAKTNFAGSARMGTSGFSFNNKLYLGTGYDGSYKQDFYEYDPTLDSWTAKASFGGGIRGEAVGASNSSFGYLGLGSNGSINQDWYEYNVTTNTWTARTNYTGGTRSDIGAFIINEIIYLNNGYNGTSNVNDMYSYMPNSTPSITTTSISSISTTSASSGGNVLGDGGTAVTARGLVWSASSNTPTTSSYDGITSNSTGTGAFTQTINALCPGTTYYVRAYATNSAGTSYGATESFTTTTSAGDIWVQKTNFGGTGRYGASQFVIGNKIYAGGGTDNSNSYNDFWEYDVYMNTWTQVANFPTANILLSQSFAVNNKGYLVGGIASGNWQKFVYEYNPNTNSWTQKNDLPIAGVPGNRAGGLGLATSTKGYLIGGLDCSTGTSDSEIWEYDPNSDTWTQRNNFGTEKYNGSMGFVVNNNLYIGLGGGCVNGVSNNFYMFNTSNNTWSQLASYPGTAVKNGIGF